MRRYRLKIVGALILLSILWIHVSGVACCIGDRGNVDGDGADLVNIADLTFLVAYLFGGGPDPVCPEEADIDASDNINIADLTYLVAYLFGGGPAPEECPPDIIDSTILALAIGNEFVTNVTEYNSSGGVVDFYQTVSTVIADTIISDSLWYVIEDTTSSDHQYSVNREDGAWTYMDTAASPEALALKFPATAGETYPYYDATIEVESINVTITVPAGTFTCHYYRGYVLILGTIAKIWAAPNIGIIKAEEYGFTLFGSYVKTRTELADYTLVEKGN